MRALSHRHGVGYSLAGLPPGRRRTLQDYQYLLGSVAAARRYCPRSACIIFRLQMWLASVGRLGTAGVGSMDNQERCCSQLHVQD